MYCSTPGILSFTVFLSSLKLTSIELVMPSCDGWMASPTQCSLLPPSLCAFSLSQHKDIFQWFGSSYQVTKVLELQLQIRTVSLDKEERKHLFRVCACVHAKSCQSCPTLCDSVGRSLTGSSVHGILQAWILEWVALFFSRESSWIKDWTHVSYVSFIGRQILYHYLGSPHLVPEL